MKRSLCLIILALTLFSPGMALSQPSAPALTVDASGLDVTMSWPSVAGSDGYRLFYAPLPYAGPSTIGQADAGNITSGTVTLWYGASFVIALQARRPRFLVRREKKRIENRELRQDSTTRIIALNRIISFR